MKISTFFKKLFSPLMVGNCLGMMLTLCLVTVGALYYFDWYTNHGASVVVPNLRGQKIEVAEKKFAALGLRVEVVDTGYVDTYVGGVVLEQNFRPGTRVKPGRIVQLTINASSARAIALPELADNSSRRQAEAKLRSMGFKYVQIEYKTGDRDWVLGVKVKGRPAQPGMRVSVTTPITLEIGDGLYDDEFNGNDSLEYETFGDNTGEELILEDGGGEVPAANGEPDANELMQ